MRVSTSDRSGGDTGVVETIFATFPPFSFSFSLRFSSLLLFPLFETRFDGDGMTMSSKLNLKLDITGLSRSGAP
jgi:hypothetical protein